MGALPPDTGFLDAAEWRRLDRQEAGVDPDHSTFERFRHTKSPRQVPAVEVPGKTIRGIVRQRNGLFLRVETEEGRRSPLEPSASRVLHFPGPSARKRCALRHDVCLRSAFGGLQDDRAPRSNRRCRFSRNHGGIDSFRTAPMEAVYFRQKPANFNSDLRLGKPILGSNLRVGFPQFPYFKPLFAFLYFRWNP